MKLKSKILLALVALMTTAFGAKAVGWPAAYQGVMLQGFYWDSYTDTKWSKLTSQADELSESFSLIWIPNAARDAAAGGNSMGYMPVYWFNNYETCFGSKSQLKTMINTFREKGTGIIGDLVLNHRSGLKSYADFPLEMWNGTTYQLDYRHVCRNDEMASESSTKPTGANDTGENFQGSRDLDHTNATVQEHCKAYCKFLLEDLGYAGFRLDMVKGYGAQYTKIYNQYSNPTFSVGEYFDGNYDLVAGWIEGTGRTSAAFDFPFKYALNNAFSNNDMSQLAWAANGDTNNMQPAGMIHYGYQQYAVTFVDNHDTYKDHNRFSQDADNELAANAFMLCSPGTPCVFLPHWKQFKTELKKIIAARNECGVTNTSSVKVLKLARNCYMAEIYGTRGKLAVRIGTSSDTPAGYSNVVSRGTKYCVWSSSTAVTYPSNLYVIGTIGSKQWDTTSSIPANSASKGVYTWTNVNIDAAGAGDPNGYFSFVSTRGANWDIVNGSDRYGASAADELISGSSRVVKYAANETASSAASWKVKAGCYNIVVDLTKMTVTLTQGEPEPEPEPTEFFVISDVNTTRGATIEYPVAMTNEKSITAFQCDIVLPAGFDLRTDEEGEYDIKLSSRAANSHQLMSNKLKTGEIRLMCYSSQKSLFTGKNGTLFTLPVVAPATSGSYTIQIKNIEITDKDSKSIYPEAVSAKINVGGVLMGDVNGDGKITIADVVSLSNAVLGIPTAGFVRDAADLDNDGELSISDIVRCVNLVLSQN